MQKSRGFVTVTQASGAPRGPPGPATTAWTWQQACDSECREYSDLWTRHPAGTQGLGRCDQRGISRQEHWDFWLGLRSPGASQQQGSEAGGGRGASPGASRRNPPCPHFGSELREWRAQEWSVWASEPPCAVICYGGSGTVVTRRTLSSRSRGRHPTPGERSHPTGEALRPPNPAGSAGRAHVCAHERGAVLRHTRYHVNRSPTTETFAIARKTEGASRSPPSRSD